MPPKVLIVGGGIVGLAAAHALAGVGALVTVIDAGAIPNPAGASFDHHRLIRTAYPGAPETARRVEAAMKAWHALFDTLGPERFASVHAGIEDRRGREPNAPFYVETGVLALSREAGDWTDRAGETFEACDLAHERMEPRELARRFPFLGVEGVRYGLVAPGGALMAGRILAALAARLRVLGVSLRAGVRLDALDAGRGVVATDGGERIDADAVLVASSAAVARIAPEHAPRLGPKRCLVAYLVPPDDLREAWANAPSWVDLGGADDLWGLAPIEGLAPKLGVGALTRPANAHDPAEASATAADLKAIVAAYRGRFLGIERFRPRAVVAARYHGEADAPFLVERRGRALLVAADNGHGFKFGALTGAQAGADIASMIERTERAA